MAGVTRVPFNISIFDDNTVENNESFTLTIDQSLPPINVTANGPGQATVTIVDDDGQFLFDKLHEHTNTSCSCILLYVAICDIMIQ